MWPVNFDSTQRPPSTMRFSLTPFDFSGGAAGSIHEVTSASQVPTIPASALWGSPGVANFCQASIIAFCSADMGLSAGFASWAAAAPATISPAHKANVNSRTFICSPPECRARHGWPSERSYTGLGVRGRGVVP